MIYSVYVLSKEGYLISARIASKVSRIEPELYLEMAREDTEVRVGIGEYEAIVSSAGDLVYVIVHDGDEKVSELLKELKASRPRGYNELSKILRPYVAPKRRDVENAIAMFSEFYKPMIGERIEIVEEEPSREGSIIDVYNDGYYREARKYKVNPEKHVLAAIRTFSARLTRMTPTIRRVPSRRSMIFYASRTPEKIRWYYQGLVENFSDFTQYVSFAETAVRKQNELIEFFNRRKLLYTTTAVPIPGLSRLAYQAVTKVPENRRDFFASWTFSTYLVEGRINKTIAERSLEGLYSDRPLSYAYYLPLAIFSSASISTGEGEVYGELLAEHLRRFPEEPRYSFFSVSTLSRSLPVLRLTAESLVHESYEHIAKLLLDRYYSDRLPHIIFGGAMATLAILALSFGDESVMNMLAQSEILRSLRFLYRFAHAGSRSATVLMRRILPAIALGILVKDRDNKTAKDVLLKSYFTISKHDFIHELIVRAAEESVSSEVADLLRSS